MCANNTKDLLFAIRQTKRIVRAVTLSLNGEDFNSKVHQNNMLKGYYDKSVQLMRLQNKLFYIVFDFVPETYFYESFLFKLL